MQLFSADAKLSLKKSKMFFWPPKDEKNTSKKLHTYGSREFLFSAAPTAQNSPELHFRFINSFIQSSLLRSLLQMNKGLIYTNIYTKYIKHQCSSGIGIIDFVN